MAPYKPEAEVEVLVVVAVVDGVAVETRHYFPQDLVFATVEDTDLTLNYDYSSFRVEHPVEMPG